MGLYKDLQDLNVEFPPTQTLYTDITINDTNFPSLKDVYFGSPYSMNLVVSRSKLTTLFLDRKPAGALPKSNINFIQAPNYQLSLSNVNVTSTDLRSSGLRIVSLDNVNNDIQLKSLNQLTYTNSIVKIFPSLDTMKAREYDENRNTFDIIWMDMQGNDLTGSLPPYDLDYAMFNNNPNLNGVLPDIFCRVDTNQMSFVGTSITDVPECFKCFWSDVSALLPATVPVPPAVPCNTTIEKTFYLLTPFVQTLEIFGNNLGYGKDATAGLSMTVPNLHFRWISKQVDWVYDLSNPYEFDAFVERMNDNWRVSTPGQFNTSMTYEMLVNNKWYPCNTTNSTLLLCEVSATLITYVDNTNITLRNIYQQFLLEEVKLFKYPSISSFSRTIDTSRNVSFFGFFGNYVDNTSVTAKVNGLTCTIKYADSNMINCSLSPGSLGLTIGYANLTIIVNGQPFISNKTLAIFPSEEVDDCGIGCNNNGQCVDHKCQCFKGFSGYYCESTLQRNVTVLSDPKVPAAIIQSNGTSLLLNIVAIQELNQEGNIVYEQRINNWTRDSNPVVTKGVKSDRYRLNTPEYGDYQVTITLDVGSEDRVVDFAGQHVRYTPNSLKMTMTIDYWYFHSNLNTLRVVIQKDGSMINDTSACGAKNVVSIDAYQNLQYLKVISNGVEMYGRFLPLGVADGRPSLVRNEIINTTTNSTFFGINMFHCRQQCMIDPDFSVLVDANPVPMDQCTTKPNDRWKIPVIVVTVSVGAIVIIAVVAKVVINQLQGRKLHHVVSHKLHKMTNKNSNVIRM
ncbi:hypothetical protein SAMD00019534_055680 [Acytostelium subglobosum LB1]|uniref:hypothetical protein n=1 Tax=Acytostelium subglobosum LB1 TaxID=1410327 RepID=UPI0006450A75|nr:hypothetical protein SAMD00019534_055680 [Acytostelium subglobosum LB1]GAM22393.1 hypothetical protein SAMD00019534_055680 [Acytostelium subglobosum LB1]|eukprot:XP_012754513.1 hypothetical protein SAMD00019534_055680 [Acytostelium subglobosum LB1]